MKTSLLAEYLVSENKTDWLGKLSIAYDGTINPNYMLGIIEGLMSQLINLIGKDLVTTLVYADDKLTSLLEEKLSQIDKERHDEKP